MGLREGQRPRGQRRLWLSPAYPILKLLVVVVTVVLLALGPRCGWPRARLAALAALAALQLAALVALRPMVHRVKALGELYNSVVGCLVFALLTAGPALGTSPHVLASCIIVLQLSALATRMLVLYAVFIVPLIKGSGMNKKFFIVALMPIRAGADFCCALVKGR